MNTTEGVKVSDAKIDVPTTEIVEPPGDGVANSTGRDVASDNYAAIDRYDQFRRQKDREYGDQRQDVRIISERQVRSRTRQFIFSVKLRIITQEI